LPGTLTALGAAGVLGTLCTVSDAATALLIAKFYELHMGATRLPPPTALHRAQTWLRQATNDDLSSYMGSQGQLETRQVAEIEQELSEEALARSRNRALIEWITPDAARVSAKSAPDRANLLARPYSHPYFWAGFIYTGL
jgi:CHAT domain-containing protein